MADDSQQIRVLLVDDSYLVRESIKAMLEFESEEFEVVGEAGNGVEAVAEALRLQPDVALIDINMPEMDGIEATEAIVGQGDTAVVMISVQGEHDYVRKAMKAGARDYLVKPFTGEELVSALRGAAERPSVQEAPEQPEKNGQVIAVYGAKGGVGKTTVAANLATGLSLDGEARVVALDLDLEFGVLATMMGVRPHGGVLDLCRSEKEITPEMAEQVVARQSEGTVGVLAAPPLPHLASEVDGAGRMDPGRSYVSEIIDALRLSYDYVIIDTAVSFREATLIALDKADLILLVTLPDIAALECTAKALDIMLERLEYPADKIQVVLNRCSVSIGLTTEEIARSLNMPLTFLIPSDTETAVMAVNTGIPFVLKRNRTRPITDAIHKIVHAVSGQTEGRTAVQLPEAKVSFSRRLLGLLRRNVR